MLWKYFSLLEYHFLLSILFNIEQHKFSINTLYLMNYSLETMIQILNPRECYGILYQMNKKNQLNPHKKTHFNC